MIHRTLVLVAVVCSMLLVVSFALFARDQLAGASKQQQNEIISSATTSPPVPAKHRPRRQPRRFIDGAAHALTSPFSSIVQSNNHWVLRGVPTFFALLVYGLGLGFLARYSRGMT